MALCTHLDVPNMICQVGTNKQLPAGQVHLDNPGLLNQHVHNSPYYAVFSTPTAGFPPTLTKGTQTKSLRLSALLHLSQLLSELPGPVNSAFY